VQKLKFSCFRYEHKYFKVRLCVDGHKPAVLNVPLSNTEGVVLSPDSWSHVHFSVDADSCLHLLSCPQSSTRVDEAVRNYQSLQHCGVPSDATFLPLQTYFFAGGTMDCNFPIAKEAFSGALRCIQLNGLPMTLAHKCIFPCCQKVASHGYFAAIRNGVLARNKKHEKLELTLRNHFGSSPKMQSIHVSASVTLKSKSDRRRRRRR
jgi:hypothetical protein